MKLIVVDCMVLFETFKWGNKISIINGIWCGKCGAVQFSSVQFGAGLVCIRFVSVENEKSWINTDVHHSLSHKLSLIALI